MQRSKFITAVRPQPLERGVYIMMTLLVALALLGTSFAVQNKARAAGAPVSFADLAERLLPAVVNIRTTSNAGIEVLH